MALGSLRTKNRASLGVSQECPGATLGPRGGSCRGLQKHMYGGGVIYSGSAVVNPFLGVSEQPLSRIANCKLDWALGASMDVRA